MTAVFSPSRRAAAKLIRAAGGRSQLPHTAPRAGPRAAQAGAEPSGPPHGHVPGWGPQAPML